MAQSVPHLTALLPYLEVSSDQPYLLSRVRLLAKTGALSLFRWNGGGDGWSDRLPSDAELLVHCLACYFDARLLTSASMRLSGTTNPQAEVIISGPPMLSNISLYCQAMKPFTGVHFYRHGEKPAEGKEDTLAIVQVGRGPAHYVVQVVTSYQDGTNFDISILNRLGRGSWMWVVVETISYTPYSSFCTGELFSSQDPAP